jgi:hypothetical protein
MSGTLVQLELPSAGMDCAKTFSLFKSDESAG